MVVLGIDPGYAIVGYGGVGYYNNRYYATGYGAVETLAGTPFNERLEQIFTEINGVIERCKPDVVAIEKLYFQNNQKTAIDVAQARGVILLAAQLNRLPVYEYTPPQVKTAVTGFGRARKEQVMEMTKRLLRLEKMPRLDDTADALAIAICHIQAYGSPLRNYLIDRGI